MKSLRKLWRLFVDDALLAAAVPLWCLACVFAAPFLPATARAGALFIGLAAALCASVLRAVGGAAGPDDAKAPIAGQPTSGEL